MRPSGLLASRDVTIHILLSWVAGDSGVIRPTKRWQNGDVASEVLHQHSLQRANEPNVEQINFEKFLNRVLDVQQQEVGDTQQLLNRITTLITTRGLLPSPV